MKLRTIALPALAGVCLLLSGLGRHACSAFADDTYMAKAEEAKPALPLAATAPTTAAPAAVPAAAGDVYGAWVGKKFQRGPAVGKVVALTFDDGPNPKTTPRVLETLKKEGVSATFFWLGQLVEKNPTLAKQIVQAGHEIGSHSWSHKNLKALSAEGARQEIISAQDIIQQVTGTRPHLFRPPYGNVNGNVEKITRDDNLVMVMWAVDSDDWKPSMNPARIEERIKSQAHPGAVILMHDIQERTVQALPAVIASLKAQGYQFVTVSKLIEEANKNPQAMSSGGAAVEEMQAPAQPLAIPLNDTK